MYGDDARARNTAALCGAKPTLIPRVSPAGTVQFNTLEFFTDAPSARHRLVVETIDPYRQDAGSWLMFGIQSSFNLVQGVRGRELDDDRARLLEDAVALYRADLLEACYEDWCIYERERLQNMFLAMLDKLMSYCESHNRYENGLQHGARILAFDRAREHTHRRLMRLQYLAGNRTGALRQYERCVAALQEELGVKPAKRTTELYEQIRADSVDGTSSVQSEGRAEPVTSSHPEVLGRLRQIRSVLIDIQREIQKDIQAVELAIRGRRETPFDIHVVSNKFDQHL